ncbi:hypothetical protein SVAN01_01555 [Stagonosporopsis vannaccii]|nr:hypothetical protein SVAN01_01555 [Stagonosporopsis vannaccii]
MYQAAGKTTPKTNACFLRDSTTPFPLLASPRELNARAHLLLTAPLSHHITPCIGPTPPKRPTCPRPTLTAVIPTFLPPNFILHSNGY